VTIIADGWTEGQTQTARLLDCENSVSYMQQKLSGGWSDSEGTKFKFRIPRGHLSFTTALPGKWRDTLKQTTTSSFPIPSSSPFINTLHSNSTMNKLCSWYNVLNCALRWGGCSCRPCLWTASTNGPTHRPTDDSALIKLCSWYSVLRWALMWGSSSCRRGETMSLNCGYLWANCSSHRWFDTE
jgi:hypothetical protein